MKEVRFWKYINGGFVRLKIKPFQKLSWGMREATDEGYSEEYFEIYHNGFDLEGEFVSGGRDCDGLLLHTFKGFRNLTNDPFKINFDECGLIVTPLEGWEKESSNVYDEFAQAAGY